MKSVVRAMLRFLALASSLVCCWSLQMQLSPLTDTGRSTLLQTTDMTSVGLCGTTVANSAVYTQSNCQACTRAGCNFVYGSDSQRYKCVGSFRNIFYSSSWIHRITNWNVCPNDNNPPNARRAGSGSEGLAVPPVADSGQAASGAPQVLQVGDIGDRKERFGPGPGSAGSSEFQFALGSWGITSVQRGNIRYVVDGLPSQEPGSKTCPYFVANYIRGLLESVGCGGSLRDPAMTLAAQKEAVVRKGGADHLEFPTVLSRAGVPSDFVCGANPGVVLIQGVSALEYLARVAPNNQDVKVMKSLGYPDFDVVEKVDLDRLLPGLSLSVPDLLLVPCNPSGRHFVLMVIDVHGTVTGTGVYTTYFLDSSRNRLTPNWIAENQAIATKFEIAINNALQRERAARAADLD